MWYAIAIVAALAVAGFIYWKWKGDQTPTFPPPPGTPPITPPNKNPPP